MKDEALLSSEFSDTSSPSGISPAVEVGRLLCAAREALHLSQSELAIRLRLGERQVIALETGNLGALPGKTFARGFIRNYALAVALDPKPLLDMLEHAPDLTEPALDFSRLIRVTMPPQGQTAHKRDRLIIAFSIFLPVMAIAIVLFAPQHLELTPESQQPENLSVLPLEHNTLVLEPVPAVPVPDTDVVPVVADASPDASLSDQKLGNLRLQFQDQSWVEITGSHGQKLHSRLHAANSSHELTVTPPVTIIIGRASSVSLDFQGKPVPLAPNSNDVALVKLQ